jgi:7-cyano-7-deazaguanine synthase
MESKSFRSLILLSGGLDSAANLALAVQEKSVGLALCFDYGQRAARSEISAAQKLCHYYSVPLKVIELKWLGQLGTSALTDSKLNIPDLETNQLDTLSIIKESAKSVWVPNRNGVLINLAGAVADAEGIKRILVGFNVEEAVTFPDNSKEYLASATESLSYSTSNQAEVFSYTCDLNKIQIVKKMCELESQGQKPFPFDMIWSCYHSGQSLCGKCESCRRLNRALEARENK